MGVQTSLHGPLFRLGAGPVIKHVRAAVQELIDEGEKKVDAELRPGHGVATGAYKSTVNGKLTGNRNGVIYDSNSVLGPWLEGTASRNRRSRFKGYRMFRKAKQRIGRIKMKVLDKHIAEAVKELGG